MTDLLARAPIVLVVEDTEDAFVLFSESLAALGYFVVGASNGIDAIDSAVRLVPDVIVMDLSLPRMGGCEAARLLKKDDRTSRIPILAITGYADEHTADEARASGCEAFLAKPFPLDQLHAEVRGLLARAESHSREGAA